MTQSKINPLNIETNYKVSKYSLPSVYNRGRNIHDQKNRETLQK